MGSKKFAFYESENFVCCPILFMMALALADNAVENGPHLWRRFIISSSSRAARIASV
jgi:hypothetical protein